MSTSLVLLSTFIHVGFYRPTKETFNVLIFFLWLRGSSKAVPKLPSTVGSKTPLVAWNYDILCIASSWLKRDVQVLYKAQYLWWRPQTLFRRYTTLLSRVHGSVHLSYVCSVKRWVFLSSLARLLCVSVVLWHARGYLLQCVTFPCSLCKGCWHFACTRKMQNPALVFRVVKCLPSWNVGRCSKRAWIHGGWCASES